MFKLFQIIGLIIVALFYYYSAAILYASTHLSDLEEIPEKNSRNQVKRDFNEHPYRHLSPVSMLVSSLATR
jgi:hypothetical protein